MNTLASTLNAHHVKEIKINDFVCSDDLTTTRLIIIDGKGNELVITCFADDSKAVPINDCRKVEAA